MTRDIKTILSEMRDLIEEIDKATNGTSVSYKKVNAKKRPSITGKPKSSAMAIRGLIEEGFFDIARDAKSVWERLKEIGHTCRLVDVRVILLRLTRDRELNRIKNKETKKWEYIVNQK